MDYSSCSSNFNTMSGFLYRKAMYKVCYVNPVSPKEHLQLRNNRKKEIIPSCLSQNAPGYLSVFLNTTLYCSTVMFLVFRTTSPKNQYSSFQLCYRRQKSFLHLNFYLISKILFCDVLCQTNLVIMSL